MIQYSLPSLVQVLGSLQNDNIFDIMGAGTLIVSNWVLTAAQCLNDVAEPKQVRISVDPYSNHGSTRSLLEVESFHPHRRYNNQDKRNDIALIRVIQQTIVFGGKSFNKNFVSCLMCNKIYSDQGNSYLARFYESGKTG